MFLCFSRLSSSARLMLESARMPPSELISLFAADAGGEEMEPCTELMELIMLYSAE
jgi:hypothetical protein